MKRRVRLSTAGRPQDPGSKWTVVRNRFTLLIMFSERRARVLDRMDEGLLILFAAPVHFRNNDVEHDYRQSSDFYYLTGFEEPRSALVLLKRDEKREAIMFVQERNRDRETWDGPRLGVQRAPGTLAVDRALPVDSLATELPELLEGCDTVYFEWGDQVDRDNLVRGAVAQVKGRSRQGIRSPHRWVLPSSLLHPMRMTKDPEEQRSIRRACEITAEAHRAAMRAARPGAREYEVEAELLSTFRRHGCDRPAYGSIVGSGPNATILHYRKNDRTIRDGELLLIDAGCEYEYYASDVTRTFPVSGTFTEPQRQLYEVVLQAQERAIAAVRPGATLELVHDQAVQALVEGLCRLGLVRESVQRCMESKSYRDYYMHRTSHWLGMDVHDVGPYVRDGKAVAFEPGFVITVEPGLYIREDAPVESSFRGLGIRIEDDILVTANGNENLTAEVPKSIQDVERATQRA